MEKELIQELSVGFEGASHESEGVEFWYARDLQVLLKYTEWRNFLKVVEKAKDACFQSDNIVREHFVDVNKMVGLGSGAEKEVDDVMLTRYACYLIAQNGDPRKSVIAFAQTYFATQARKQEQLEEQLEQFERLQARAKLTETEKQLSQTLYKHGVDSKGFGAVRSRGDNALFGITTREMKNRLGVKNNRALADFLPTVTLKAKEFAAAITEFNVNKSKISGVKSIGDEHVKNNKNVRGALMQSNIQPESLPAAEDIKKIERRQIKKEKKIAKQTKAISNT